MHLVILCENTEHRSNFWFGKKSPFYIVPSACRAAHSAIFTHPEAFQPAIDNRAYTISSPDKGCYMSQGFQSWLRGTDSTHSSLQTWIHHMHLWHLKWRAQCVVHSWHPLRSLEYFKGLASKLGCQESGGQCLSNHHQMTSLRWRTTKR